MKFSGGIFNGLESGCFSNLYESNTNPRAFTSRLSYRARLDRHGVRDGAWNWHSVAKPAS